MTSRVQELFLYIYTNKLQETALLVPKIDLPPAVQLVTSDLVSVRTWATGRPKKYLSWLSLATMKERMRVRKVPRIRVTGNVLYTGMIHNNDHNTVLEILKLIIFQKFVNKNDKKFDVAPLPR
jgi:hypothetical protein